MTEGCCSGPSSRRVCGTSSSSAAGSTSRRAPAGKSTRSTVSRVPCGTPCQPKPYPVGGVQLTWFKGFTGARSDLQLLDQLPVEQDTAVHGQARLRGRDRAEVRRPSRRRRRRLRHRCAGQCRPGLPRQWSLGPPCAQKPANPPQVQRSLKVTIRGDEFCPDDATVAAGASVTICNGDPVSLKVYGLGPLQHVNLAALDGHENPSRAQITAAQECRAARKGKVPPLLRLQPDAGQRQRCTSISMRMPSRAGINRTNSSASLLSRRGSALPRRVTKVQFSNRRAAYAARLGGDELGVQAALRRDLQPAPPRPVRAVTIHTSIVAIARAVAERGAPKPSFQASRSGSVPELDRKPDDLLNSDATLRLCVCRAFRATRTRPCA